MRVWVLTDGKAGDEQQCLGVAEALGGTVELRRVKPWAPFVWLMPYGPIDPFEAPGRAGQPDRAALPRRRDRLGAPRRALCAPRQAGVAAAQLHGVPEGPRRRSADAPT